MRGATIAPVLLATVLSGCGGSGGAGAPSAGSPAQDAPVGVTFSRVAGGLVNPVHITNAGDGSGRIFIVEQPGRIRISDNGALLPAPFLDIAARVLSGGERGLLSVAFPPGYAGKGHFYVNYTSVPDGDTVVARYRVTADPNLADGASETVILTIAQPFANHNGGQIAFGPDGFLYIGMGDGGSGGDPLNNAQNPGELLGKLLRIDVESGAVPYGIPPDNPFLGAAGFRAEIWAMGLRNPWRFSFDRGTGDLYLADVGQGLFEEVNHRPAGGPGGENYGWNIMEGAACFGSAGCDPAGLLLPVAAYSHAAGCSVTGGHVYRGQRFPALQGFYFYGDFCSGLVWGLRQSAAGFDNFLLSDTPFTISTFGEDEAGEIFLADYATGDILRIGLP